MSQLRVANVRRCLDILREFHDAVKVDNSNEKLKKRAGKALDHLDNLFAPDPGEYDIVNGCTPKVQSIT